jgi:hypothetical protein
MRTPDEGARYEGSIGAASGRRQNLPIVTVVLILCLVAGLHLVLWRLAEPHTVAVPVEARLGSVSYNRFARPSSGNLKPCLVRCWSRVASAFLRPIFTGSSRPICSAAS